VNTATPPAADLRLLVGYDGSQPANRALRIAARMLQGRSGAIEVVYVAHIPGMASLSPGAVAELESGFDDIEQELRTMVAEELTGPEQRWGFERREGLVAEELLAAAKDLGAANPDATVVVVVGSSSTAAHRVMGSVAVHLARHSPVALLVVP
jgi:nucleotide-binding universal stress UspA family protein